MHADGLGLTSGEEIAAVHHVLSMVQVAKPPFKPTALKVNKGLRFGVRDHSPHSNSKLQIMAEMVRSPEDAVEAIPSEPLPVVAMPEIGGEDCLERGTQATQVECPSAATRESDKHHGLLSPPN
jgi:hypothetical protein